MTWRKQHLNENESQTAMAFQSNQTTNHYKITELSAVICLLRIKFGIAMVFVISVNQIAWITTPFETLNGEFKPKIYCIKNSLANIQTNKTALLMRK